MSSLLGRHHRHVAGYLDTPSVGLPTTATVAALSEAIATWQCGEARPQDYDQAVAASRTAFADLVGVEARDVAVGSQVSVFIGMIASSLASGTEVLIPEEEFTSVLFPFLARGDLHVRTVPLVELADAVDASTGLVVFSLVQSADGRLVDVEAVVAAAAEHGAMTLADGTQACGWLPVDANRFDVLVVAAYKWLLSPRGTAFMVLRQERLEEIVPTAAGWYAGEDVWTSIYGAPLRLAADARRFDVSPAWLAWVGTAPAIQAVLDIGIADIHRHAVGLADRFCDGLGRPRTGSAIVSLSVTDAQAAALRSAGIRASQRAGRLRAGFHLTADVADVDAAVAVLRSA